uniref:Uncharacterized protein n=1 Tax=Periophthalmus magnuspinnatus TaxID=409849 RepID=A0A3B4BBS2_9GOBI
ARPCSPSIMLRIAYPPLSVGVSPNRVQSPTDMSRELSTVTTAASASPHLDFTIFVELNSLSCSTMFSFCLRQILTLPFECLNRNRDSSDQATFFQSSMVQFW